MSEAQTPNQPEKPKEKVLEGTPWTCKLESAGKELTVGVVQDLVCSGDFVEKLDPKKTRIKFQNKKFDYSLKILEKPILDHTSLTLKVTSYKAGNFQKPVFIITDGEKSIKVNDLSWTVKSVLANPKEEPAPSMGPFALAMPWWFWTSVGIGVFIVLLLVFLKIKKIWQRKKIIEELTNHSTALPPFHQFNKDLRNRFRAWQQSEITDSKNIERVTHGQLLESTEKIFRQYLMRELLIPAMEWNENQILDEIKKRHRKIYFETSQDIKKILREIKQAKKGEDKITAIDCEQLVNMARRTSEKIYEIKAGGK